MSDVVNRMGKLLSMAEARRAAKLAEHWTLDRLMATELPPTRFFVPRILPEGLGLVVAATKTGKSYLVSGIALALACGGNVLGKLPVRQEEVVYLDLEQTAGKAQERWSGVLRGDRAPATLHTFFSWRRMDEGGLDDLVRFLDEHPRVRVVIVDVFTSFKPTRMPRGANAYDAEYVMLTQLRDFANARHLSLLLVHHTNRSGKTSTDPLDSISGTNALSGVPDAVWMLTRSRSSVIGQLYVTGRSARESEFELAWDRQIGGWSIVMADFDLAELSAKLGRERATDPTWYLDGGAK